MLNLLTTKTVRSLFQFSIIFFGFLISSGYADTITRIGSIEVPYGKQPDFDVIVDKSRDIIHFVWCNSGTARYFKSENSGRSWNVSQLIGTDIKSLRIANDSHGNLHTVYGKGSERNLSKTIHYRKKTLNGNWENEISILSPPDARQICGPRIAVDGNDNVHIIAWMLPKNEVYAGHDWKNFTKCLYIRKLAGQNTFESLMEFRRGKSSEGGGYHGDLAVDNNGDVHIFYTSWKSGWESTYFLRHKDGTWSDWVKTYKGVASDFASSIAIDKNNRLHVSGFETVGKHPRFDALNWAYYNNTQDVDVLKKTHSVKDDWEFATHTMLCPDNDDVWMVNCPWMRPAGSFLPKYRARFMHYNSKTKNWSTPKFISAPNYRNNDSRNKDCNTPKYIYYNNKVLLYYAESYQKEGYKFYQRECEDYGTTW